MVTNKDHSHSFGTKDHSQMSEGKPGLKEGRGQTTAHRSLDGRIESEDASGIQ